MKNTLTTILLNIVSLSTFLFSEAGKAEYTQDSWAPLYEGIAYQLQTKTTDHGKLRIHLMKLDVQDTDLSLFVQQTCDRDDCRKEASQTGQEFIKETGAQIAFSSAMLDPILNSSLNMAGLISHLFEKQWPEYEDIDAFQTILSKGKRLEFPKSERIARSSIGISEDRHTLYFVIVEGGPRYGFWFKDLISIGVTVSELADLMLEFGIYDAVQIDSNRYLSLVSENLGNEPLVLNLPIDDRNEEEIALPTHIGVRAKALSNGSHQKRLLAKYSLEKTSVRNYRKQLRLKGAAPQHCYKPNACPISLNSDKHQIIELKDLKLIDRKFLGEATGGVFRDKHEVVWFVKAGYQPIHEYIAAQLIHRMRPKHTPLIKLLADTEEAAKFKSTERKILTASRQIVGFEPASLRKPSSIEKIRKNGSLKVAMDWIGLGDRSEFNQGYILQHQEFYAARVDFDNAFDTENGWFSWEHTEKDMIKQLEKNLEQYSLFDLDIAIKMLSSISDEEITSIVETACKDISIAYSLENPCSVAPFKQLSDVLIRRKRAAQTFQISYQHFQRSIDSFPVHVVRVNQHRMKIAIAPTLNFDTPEKLTAIAQRTNAIIALNAGFWNFGPSIIPINARLFFSKKLGIHWYPAYPNNVLVTDTCRILPSQSSIAIAWNPGETALLGIYPNHEQAAQYQLFDNSICPLPQGVLPFEQLQYAVGIYPTLTNDGVLTPNLDDYDDIRAKEKAPRTGVCIGKNDEWNFIVAEKSTLQDFGKFMLTLNCKFSANLDGGGSSSLFVNNKLVFGGNDAAWSKERPISDAIIITE